MIEKKIIKVVAMSDAHWNFPYINVPECDIFMYCGDWSGYGSITEQTKFCYWVKNINARYKLIVPGNHDMYCYYNPDIVKGMLLNVGAMLLIDKEVDCFGIKIYGTPWAPRFGDWGFMRPDSDLYDYFLKIPRDAHFLLTHTPPNGILDLSGTKHIGSKSLKKVLDFKYIPYHFFGHNHTPGSYIRKKNRKRYFYNVSVCDDNYNVVVEPKIMEFEATYEVTENTKILLEIQKL